MNYQEAYDHYDNLIKPEVEKIQQELWKLSNKKHLTDKECDRVEELQNKIVLIETGIVGMAEKRLERQPNYKQYQIRYVVQGSNDGVLWYEVANCMSEEEAVEELNDLQNNTFACVNCGKPVEEPDASYCNECFEKGDL